MLVTRQTDELLIYYLLGGVRLCGDTGTVFGPGFGALGFFPGVGDGLDLL